MTRREERPAVDYNAGGRFWSPMLYPDGDPPFSKHEGDGELLPSVPLGDVFARLLWGDWESRAPSGVIDYKRVPLARLCPELEGVLLPVWYRVPRIRCCGYLSLDATGKLADCSRCRNRGYVCPTCLAARWVVVVPQPLEYVAVPCPSCTWDGIYRADQEMRAVQGWLAHYYPDGVLFKAQVTPG